MRLLILLLLVGCAPPPKEKPGERTAQYLRDNNCPVYMRVDGHKEWNYDKEKVETVIGHTTYLCPEVGPIVVWDSEAQP